MAGGSGTATQGLNKQKCVYLDSIVDVDNFTASESWWHSWWHKQCHVTPSFRCAGCNHCRTFGFCQWLWFPPGLPSQIFCPEFRFLRTCIDKNNRLMRPVCTFYTVVHKVSQGSVATDLRWGENYNKFLVRNSLLNTLWKNYENPSIFARVIENNKCLVFMDTLFM